MKWATPGGHKPVSRGSIAYLGVWVSKVFCGVGLEATGQIGGTGSMVLNLFVSGGRSGPYTSSEAFTLLGRTVEIVLCPISRGVVNSYIHSSKPSDIMLVPASVQAGSPRLSVASIYSQRGQRTCDTEILYLRDGTARSTGNS